MINDIEHEAERACLRTDYGRFLRPFLRTALRLPASRTSGRRDACPRQTAWSYGATRQWHQQLARIIDHRFRTFKDLEAFALDAKQAGVSALMLVQIQRAQSCPGPWYNGLPLRDHINGPNPAADGSLDQWRRLLQAIRPMRLMWWTNPAYWSVQGPVWAQAVANRHSDVGSWFSWGDEHCKSSRRAWGATWWLILQLMQVVPPGGQIWN